MIIPKNSIFFNNIKDQLQLNKLKINKNLIHNFTKRFNCKNNFNNLTHLDKIIYKNIIFQRPSVPLKKMKNN